MRIWEATGEDFEQIWPIFSEIASAGETYAYARNTTKDEALKIWMDAPRKTYVLEENRSCTYLSYDSLRELGA